MMTKSPTRISKTKIGWILIVAALVLCFLMSYITVPDLFQWYAIESQPAKTTGVVTGSKAIYDATGAVITYQFEIANADGSVKSYTKSQNINGSYSVNAEVPIEYAASNPAYSRIQGEGAELLPRLLITGIFIPFAAVMFYAGVRTIKSGMRQKRYQAEAPSCPYCGAKLRTKFAKQCGQCNRDWHDKVAANSFTGNRV